MPVATPAATGFLSRRAFAVTTIALTARLVGCGPLPGLALLSLSSCPSLVSAPVVSLASLRGLICRGPRRVTRHGLLRNAIAEQSLDRFQKGLLVAIDERNGHALAAGPARATDAVHVVLGHLGQVEVHDVR